MKMNVVMTRKEFEGAVLAALNIYGKAQVEEIYWRADGGLECTVRTVEEPVHSSRNPTDDCTTTPVTVRPQLWTPDPPPFIRTVEAAPAAEPEARPWKELHSAWWPPRAEQEDDYTSALCACKKFGVFKTQGWVHDGNLHTQEHCEEEEVAVEPPAISAAAALSASSTGEYGTVESPFEDKIPF